MLKRETQNTFKQVSKPKGSFSALKQKAPEVTKTTLKRWIPLFFIFDVAVAVFIFSCVFAIRLAIRLI